jgi:hypothetical protein
MTGTMYMDMFLNVPEPKNKVPADDLGLRKDNAGSFNASLPSATPGEGQKKSRWRLRKDQYIEKVKGRAE